MTAVLGPGRPFTGNERELLESTLDLHRTELVAAVAGLSDAQARQQLVPSLTTPISLVKHCAAAERIWFQRTLAAMAAEDCDGHSTGGDSSFRITPGETLAGVVTEYAAACKKSREIAAGRSLDDTAEHRVVGTVNLRFIYLCMIGDVARHAGQADILVEQIRAGHHTI
ncbi:MAG: DinB family protein [Actinomycetota bacterium]|nr:DinB family protein [Actinomycetota bacterium]